MKAPSPLVTLSRYFIAADEMRIRFEETLKHVEGLHSLVREGRLSAEGVRKAFDYFAGEQGVFMLYWPAALYVVVEGFRELRLHDEKIEKLLESSHVDALRLVRNATFHFQKKFISAKLMPFSNDDAIDWAWSLHVAFDEFFRREFAEDT
jgi:hypothetical protein